MTKRRTRSGARKQLAPYIILTFDQLLLLQEALQVIDQVALLTRPQPNLELAQTTINEMQEHVNHMIEHGAWDEEIRLSKNAIILLQASVWIFSLKLDMLPASSEKEKKQQVCRELTSLFTPFLKEAPMLDLRRP